MIFLQLFWTFFVIGLLTIGGGYAMLPLIQQRVVADHQWISGEEFANILAVSEMTPGPIGINTATYIGYSVVDGQGYGQLVSILGSFISTGAVVLPSFIIVLGLCRLYGRFNRSAVFNGFMSGLRPVVTGLIGAAAVLLITPGNFTGWESWAILAAAFCLAMWSKVHPIIILLLCGAAGYFFL